jgi:hypothetical protein
MKKRNGIYLVAMLACLLGAFALPQTRTLSQIHLKMLTHPEQFMEESPSTGTGTSVKIATGDFDAVIAVTKASPGHVENLLPLVAQFPERKELHAHILRYACDSDKGLSVAFREPESTKNTKLLAKDQTPPYARLLESAARGEQLDPENAYFPFMAAIVHCAQNQDNLAWSDLHRAAQKPHYEDYSYTQTIARWKANEKRFGGRNSLSDTATFASILLPHFATQRSFTRVVLGEVQQREQRGDTAGGVALRHDIAQMGAKMRVEGRTIISNLVGTAITSIAGSKYPGAMSKEEQKQIKDSWERAEQVREGYLKYLTRIGQTEEARWYRAETDANLQSRNISKTWFDDKNKDNLGNQQLYKMARTGMMTAMTPVILLNLLNLIILGGIAAGLLRLPRIRAEKPLSKGADMGIALLLYLGTFALSFLILGKQILQAGPSISSFVGSSDEDNFSASRFLMVPVLMSSVCMFVPYILLLATLIPIAVRKRKARRAGEVLPNQTPFHLSGITAAILPTAAIVSLVYLGALLYASHHEQIAQTELNEMVQHEAQFYSRISHQPLPGAVK